MATQPEVSKPAGAPVLVDEQGPIPTFGPAPVDDRGRLVMTDEECRARGEALARFFRLLETLPDDDPPGIDIEIMRAIDEGRPHRKLFEGMY